MANFLSLDTCTNGGIFGDDALFDEFESVPLNEAPLSQQEREEEAVHEIMKTKLAKLEQENERLKCLLRNLIPPRGIHVQNTESGPIAHVIFLNNDLTRKYRQEAEEFFEKLVARGESSTPTHQSGMIDIDDDDDDDSVQIKPQRSSRTIIEEDNEIKKEAYLSTGNVQYYQMFCVDQLGRPLINGDAQLTGWCMPTYSSVFLEALPVDENPQGAKKAGRPKNKCWNCDSEDHGLRECPAQRDLAKISANKQLHQSMSTPQQKRYLKDSRGKDGKGADRFSKFTPGVISDELREAMGIRNNQLPMYIYKMRHLGYPPGWMREAEVVSSGMRVYDIKKSNEDGEIDDGSEDQHDDRLTYDPRKLVEYPGFNMPPPEGVIDEWRELGAKPMQADQRKELQELYMTPPEKDKERGQKRRGSFMNSKETKKHKSERNEEDMQVEKTDSDEPSTPSSRGWFSGDKAGKQVFKPPLPPTPGTASPLPPLPLSTPPHTPGQTPPHSGQQTPTHDSDYTPMPSPGSSAPLGLSAPASQETSRSPSPTVEELEFQQKQLMEALMDAGASSMASDTDGTSEVAADSMEEDNTQDGEDTQKMEKKPQDDLKPPGEEEPGEILESPESPDAVSNAQPEENRTINDAEDTPTTSFKIQNPPELHKDLSGDTTPNKSGVPRLSNFASGITPHVVESLAEATGCYKKLLGILKTKGSKSK